jgi:hypothetical protein
MGKYRSGILSLALLGILLLLPILACNPPTPEPGGPTITIIFPPDGAAVTVGQQVLIQSASSDEKGIARVDLIINSVVVRADPPVDGTPKVFALAQPWFPAAPGDVAVQVIAYNVENRPSPPASITLHVVEPAVVIEPTAVSPTSTPAPDVPGEGGCMLNASFVADLTIPDGSVLQPGVSFVKMWRIRNSGTCDWTGSSLVFVGGGQLGAPAVIAVPVTSSGAVVDISAPMTAPAAPGTYMGNWRMRSNTGEFFGSTFWVSIVVPSPATNTPKATSTPTPTLTLTAGPTATPTPTVTPTVTSEPTATHTPTPTSISEPTATYTPTPTLTPEPTATYTPTPTPTETETPTATPGG